MPPDTGRHLLIDPLTPKNQMAFLRAFRGEFWYFPCGDLDLFAGSRVSSLSGFSLGNGDSAETGKCLPVVFLERCLYAIKKSFRAFPAAALDIFAPAAILPINSAFVILTPPLEFYFTVVPITTTLWIVYTP